MNCQIDDFFFNLERIFYYVRLIDNILYFNVLKNLKSINNLLKFFGTENFFPRLAPNQKDD